MVQLNHDVCVFNQANAPTLIVSSAIDVHIQHLRETRVGALMQLWSTSRPLTDSTCRRHHILHLADEQISYITPSQQEMDVSPSLPTSPVQGTDVSDQPPTKLVQGSDDSDPPDTEVSHSPKETQPQIPHFADTTHSGSSHQLGPYRIFLDICSGATRPLSQACLNRGKCILSFDILINADMDLLNDNSYEQLLRLCSSGVVPYASASPSCGQYS